MMHTGKNWMPWMYWVMTSSPKANLSRHKERSSTHDRGERGSLTGDREAYRQGGGGRPLRTPRACRSAIAFTNQPARHAAAASRRIVHRPGRRFSRTPTNLLIGAPLYPPQPSTASQTRQETSPPASRGPPPSSSRPEHAATTRVSPRAGDGDGDGDGKAPLPAPGVSKTLLSHISRLRVDYGPL